MNGVCTPPAAESRVSCSDTLTLVVRTRRDRGRRARGLAPGEQVVVEVRPHWWVLVWPLTWTAAVIAGGIAGAVETAPAALRWLALVVLVLSVGWLVGDYIGWRCTRLFVTDRRVIEKRGALRRQVREIQIPAVADLRYEQRLLERVIGIGDLVVDSAGGAGRETFRHLPHPEEIHREIFRQLVAWRTAAVAQGPSIPDQIDQLDRLRQRGVISDAEFHSKKAELLGRL